MLRRLAPVLASAALAVATGCGDPVGISPLDAGGGDGGACDPGSPPSRTASCVLSIALGPGAGHGTDRFPEVVFGPPLGGGARQGSLDVLSLGKGGSIALGFGGGAIVDGPGPDFLVFENAFYYARTADHPDGDPTRPFAELGQVAVSQDGETWRTFPCAAEAWPFDGCAGWHAVFSSPEGGVSPHDPAVAGGDAFDLADLGIAEARFVRVTDVSNAGAPDNAGFDLDAIAIVNGR